MLDLIPSHWACLVTFSYEKAILEALGDDWLTIAKIRTRMKRSTAADRLSIVLERMAEAGVIERTSKATNAVNRSGKSYELRLYRQRPAE